MICWVLGSTAPNIPFAMRRRRGIAWPRQGRRIGSTKGKGPLPRPSHRRRLGRLGWGMKHGQFTVNTWWFTIHIRGTTGGSFTTGTRRTGYNRGYNSGTVPGDLPISGSHGYGWTIKPALRLGVVFAFFSWCYGLVMARGSGVWRPWENVGHPFHSTVAVWESCS